MLLNPSNNYQIPVGLVYRLNRANLNELLADIGQRIKDCEDVRAEFQAIIDAGTTQALAMVQENIEPQLVDVANTIAELNSALEALQLAQAQILNQGVAGNKVTLTPIAGMASTHAQGAIAELKDGLTTLQTGSVTSDDVVGLILAFR